MLSADSWGFYYNSELNVNKNQTIGARLGPGFSNQANFIKTYIGIDLVRRRLSSINELTSVIASELHSGIPICICIDSYDCPWHPWYAKQHQDHYFLIVGVISQRELELIDPMFQENRASMNLDLLSNVNTEIITFLMDEDYVKNIPWQVVIKQALDKLYGITFNDKNHFANMRLFARDIASIQDLKAEIAQHTFLNAAPLFFNMHHVSLNRMKFATVLEYMFHHFEAQELLDCCDKLKISGKLWRNVEHLILKACFINNPYEILKKAESKIIEIAELEEQIALCLEQSIRREIRDIDDNYNTWRI